MIEVVHYTNRYGRRKIAVFGVHVAASITLERIKYNERYTAGLEKPYYPVPVPIEYSHAFAIRYVIQLLTKGWDTEGP